MGTVLILSRKQRAVAETAGLKYTRNIVSSVRVRGKQIEGISSQEKAARMTNGGIRNRCYNDASAKAGQQSAAIMRLQLIFREETAKRAGS